MKTSIKPTQLQTINVLKKPCSTFWNYNKCSYLFKRYFSILRIVTWFMLTYRKRTNNKRSYVSKTILKKSKQKVEETKRFSEKNKVDRKNVFTSAFKRSFVFDWEQSTRINIIHPIMSVNQLKTNLTDWLTRHASTVSHANHR